MAVRKIVNTFAYLKIFNSIRQISSSIREVYLRGIDT